MIPIIVEFASYHQIKIVEYIISDNFITDFKDFQLGIHLNKARRSQLYSIYRKLQSLLNYDINTLVHDYSHDFGLLSVYILCYDSYVYPLYQIDHYDWIDKEYVINCCTRLMNFRNSIAPENNNNAELVVQKDFNLTCTHTTKKPVELELFGRVDDIIADNIIEYKVSNKFNDMSHKAQLLMYLWLLKKTKGYIYYPNYDAYIEIIITDQNEFDISTLNWFNNLMTEYYQLCLPKY